ncbi:TcfC E-set like domain-containing protein [Vibrio cincinnatiensis]|uniref:TcfC E-set like domain-containing protein n=1 Tax=Vibrio cincinnatiensis TaxID=675 RepID=UPI0012ACB22E|nr:TcfC E-set like domain-containing protein [Vibrio cincinnatiensis]
MKYHYLTAISLSIIAQITSLDVCARKLTVINNVNIPAIFLDVLSSGISVPVKLQYVEGVDNYSLDNAVTATIQLVNNNIRISYITLEESSIFSNEFQQLIDSTTDRIFDLENKIILDDGSFLTLDLSELTIILHLTEKSFAKIASDRKKLVNESSVKEWTSIASYSLGISGQRINEYISSTNIHNYLNLNTTTAYQEHHFYIDSSFYGLGTTHNDANLRRIMYEKDFTGHRFAFGMLSGWDLQSLGQVSALNAEKIWGVSIGNQSYSSYIDRSQSLTPLFVFLPAAGEVRVYRDKKLISIQNFSLGNQEIDTRKFPFGLYDVDVEVIVNGEVVSKTTQRVDKYSTTNIPGTTQWQLWGGFMEPFHSSYETKKEREEITYLIGMSAAKNYGKINLSGSIYSFDSVGVAEVRANTKIMKDLDLNSLLLLGSDRSWRTMNSLNYNINSATSIWINHEKGEYGNQIYNNDVDNYSLGSSINLPSLGLLSLNHRHNNITDSDNTSIDYYQSIVSGRYGTLSMRLGYHEDKSEYSSLYNKSVSFDLTIPLDSRITLGVTNDNNGATVANIGYNQTFKEGPIRSLGGSLNSEISNSEEKHKVNGSGYINYQTNHAQGSVTTNRSRHGDWSTSITANGNIGLTKDDIISSGNYSQKSGVIIKTGLKGNKNLITTINGIEHKIKGDKTFIPLASYQEYKLTLQNSKDNRDSFDINDSEHSITLYPGNIYTHDISHSIKEMVTVFGILQDESRLPLANIRVSNHIGSTITDKNGEFVIDIDKQFPTVMATSKNGAPCEAELNLSTVTGAVWLGETICYEKESYAAK